MTTIDNLTPEQIEVLKMIDEDGIDAPLSDAQWKVRDQLEDMKLIYGSGDEYDFDVFISREGKLLLDQLDPKWWSNAYMQREFMIERTRQLLEQEPVYSSGQVERYKQEYDGKVSRERERTAKYTSHLIEKLAELKQELEAWMTENKSHIPSENSHSHK